MFEKKKKHTRADAFNCDGLGALLVRGQGLLLLVELGAEKGVDQGRLAQSRLSDNH